MRSILPTLVLGALPSGVAAQSITSVSPAAGTVGDLVTIAGSGFGDKKPSVTLKSTTTPTKTFSLKVTSHSDTTIVGQVMGSAKGGDFDVRVKIPGVPDPITATGAFTVAPPQISSVTPATVAPGDLVTVTGDFFGPKSGGKLTLRQIEKRSAQIVSWTDTQIVFRAPASLVDGAVHIAVARKPIGSADALNGFLVSGSAKKLGNQRILYRALGGTLYTAKLIINSATGTVQNISGISAGGNPKLTLQLIFDQPDGSPQVLDGSELPLPAVLTYTETPSGGSSHTWSKSGGGSFTIAVQVVTPDKIAGTFSGLLKSPGKQDRTLQDGRFVVKRPPP